MVGKVGLKWTRMGAEENACLRSMKEEWASEDQLKGVSLRVRRVRWETMEEYVDIFPSTSGDFLILSNLFNLSIALLIHTVSSRVNHPHLVLIVFYTYHTTHKALLVLP